MRKITIQRSLTVKLLNTLLLSSITLVPQLCSAEDQSLLGDWGGARSWLEQRGVEMELIATHDYVANVDGGLRRTSGVLGNIDLTATIDTEKAGLWNSGTMFFYALGNYGRNPTEFVGDLQATNNIEAYDTAKLYEGWYEHQWLDGRVSFLGGLHDLNSEFNTLEYAGALINSSFGIEIDISQVGPSIFNTTALGSRLRLKPTESSYIQSAIYDGIPGSPSSQRGTRIDFREGDGTFSIIEVGYTALPETPWFKIAGGWWYHTAEFEDYAGEMRDSNWGLYGIGEATLFTPEEIGTGVGFFLQYGNADRTRNQIKNYWGAGLQLSGVIPDRDDDTLSFGINQARNSGGYREITEDTTAAETVLEFTYQMQVTPWFSLQPDLQWVKNPGTSKSTDDALVLGVRTEVSL